MLSNIIILLVLIALNGFFSMSEMAVVSSRRQRLQALLTRRKQTGAPHAGPETALQLQAEPGRFLSSVQIGITLVGVFAGAFGGATLAGPLGAAMSGLPWIGAYAEPAAFGLVVVIITYLSLIVGELAPKRIALSNPEGIASAIARPMSRLSRLLGPAVTFLSWSTEAVIRVYGIAGREVPKVTEDEIKHLVEEGAASGAIEGVERDIVNRVFHLGDTRVAEIMTPRVQLVWLDAEETVEQNLALIREQQKMRYPVRRGPSGPFIGMIRLEDLFLQPRSNDQLLARMSPPLYIPRTASVLKALSILQSENMFMGLVIDEYGDVVGTITMSEIFFAMIGDISDHAANNNSAVAIRDDGSWIIDGVVSVEEVRRLLKLEKLPGDESSEVNTLAGVMFNWFGRLPREGDYFAWNGYRFEIVDMDGPRIDKVLIVPAQNLPIGSALARSAD
ncbi:MAG: hemolysin family protein [Parvibaculum sp.]|uniref:hemolysin family protein n=1 Tax=Parvibaculum sp. TaxID=2024848 RepID=UPI002AB91072|nr:hemolysin family protein [Parvibaculum sp.]MDZ4382145.1 hemolysin family protein [Parvibaculum sp.]